MRQSQRRDKPAQTVMQAGIVGLPYVGKTTLFSALTGQMIDATEGGTHAHVGMVSIVDDRLEVLARYIESKKVVPAAMKLVDIAGLTEGSSTGMGIGGKFLEQIRPVDVLIHVVRCFESGEVAHVEGDLDPARDMDIVETEIILHDLGVVESALPKTEKMVQGGKDPAAAARLAVLEKMRPVLEDGRPARTVTIDDPRQTVALSGFGFLSTKKMLYVANVDEEDIGGEGPLAAGVRERAREQGMEAVAVCAQLDRELAELPEKERAEMLEPLGLTEPAANLLVRAAYRLLGLQSFYTANRNEIRAWPIRVGATAHEAAGVVHSDMQRGFIRAEVFSVSDLEELGSEKALRETGRLRGEGRDDVMQVDDVARIRFNV